MGSDSWRCTQTDRHQLNIKFLSFISLVSLTALRMPLLQPHFQEQRG